MERFLNIETFLQRTMTEQQLQARSKQEVLILPCGYVDAHGNCHYEVELEPITGKEEEFLIDVPVDMHSAHIVTRLLSACIKRIGIITGPDQSLIRDLLIRDRDYLIIKLREMTFGKKVEIVLYCPDVSCGKAMDVTFSLEDMQIERKPVSKLFFTIQFPGPEDKEKQYNSVEFRLPTGGDQEAVASFAGVNEKSAVNHLLARCIRSVGQNSSIDEAQITQLSDSVRREIEEKMQQLAPLIDFEIDSVCPECKKPFTFPLNFTDLFFAEMKRNFRTLEQEVHLLAWHYHWSERDILSMNRKKRKRYVAFLEEEIEKLTEMESYKRGF